jgi:hypothetical protein
MNVSNPARIAGPSQAADTNVQTGGFRGAVGVGSADGDVIGEQTYEPEVGAGQATVPGAK